METSREPKWTNEHVDCQIKKHKSKVLLHLTDQNLRTNGEHPTEAQLAKSVWKYFKITVSAIFEP